MLMLLRWLLLLFLTPLYAKPVEIVLWHSLAGNLGTEFQQLVSGFNQSQADFMIKLIYKGDYIESLTSFAAAFRAHQPPSLIQVFEVGTATMLRPKGIIKSADDIMREQKIQLPKNDFFPAVKAYYSQKGRLMAMPLNISVPALFYNADAVAKLGYTADTFPTTWDGLEILAAKLRHSGFSCAYTSAYPAWILIESFSALHGLPLVDGATHKAIYNNQKLMRHLQRLQRWQGQHYFEYGGRSDDATILFTSGRCPLLSQSSGIYNSLIQWVPFHVGMAAMPLDTQASQHRYNNVTGGGALWATAGQTPAVYKGIAKFFIYLAQAKVQQKWHQNTGYLPLGIVGGYKELTLKNLHPSLQLVQREWMNDQDPRLALPFGAQNQIRAINDEALEAIFAGMQSPQLAMAKAVMRANHTLLRFQRNTSSN